MKSTTTDVIEAKEEEVDLESVLRELNIYGRYHIKLMILIGILSWGSMWSILNYVFAVENFDYMCKSPGCSFTELLKLENNTNFDYKCHKNFELYNSNSTCTKEYFNVTNAADCHEWVYDRPDSFVAEFNLGCEDWKRTLVGTMHSVGRILGLFLLGPISDKYGRKNLIIFTSIACAVIGLSKSIVYSYWIYVALETLEPALGNYYSATYTLAIESVTKEMRPFMAFVVSIFSTFGGMSVAVIAWLSPNWRIFLLSIYAPGLISILYIFWMDESLRWLLSKGKKTEAYDLIRQAAKINKIIIDEDKLSQLKCEETSSNVNLKTLLKMTFSSKKLLLRLLCCICMWFTCLFNTHTLLINSVSLKGNKYLNFTLTASAGIPASVAVYYLLMKCKRKKPLIFSFLLTGLFCTAHAIVPTDYVWLSIVIYISGRLCSSTGMRIVRIYTSELFPTYTRNTMIALCSALGGTAVIIAPQTPLLMDYWPGLPSLIMAVLSMLTTCVVILLPDTSDDVLPENVCEAEAVGKKEKEIEMCSKL